MFIIFLIYFKLIIYNINYKLKKIESLVNLYTTYISIIL